MRKLDKVVYVAALLLVTGCAGWNRQCSSSCANNMGADWVVVQTDMDGRPFRCWTLNDVSVANEDNSDGIYWQSADGHLVHISNNYVRVQVDHGGFEGALAEIGMTTEQCARLAKTQLEDSK